MITKEEALKIFKKEHKNDNIINACVYKSKRYKRDFYVFTTDIDGKIDYNDPHYAVDSISGAILNFDITTDLRGFFNAVKNNSFIGKPGES